MFRKIVSTGVIGIFALSVMELSVAANADNYRIRVQPNGYHYDGCGRDTATTIRIGAIGGPIGNQSGRTFATVGAAILGGVAGNAISRSACRDNSADAYYYNNAYADAFDRPEYGRKYSWHNPYTGHHGYVAPMHESSNANCREFKHYMFVDGQRAEAYGTACRQGDGSWRILQG